MLGWNNKETMVKCYNTSIYLLLAYGIAKYLQIPSYYLDPYASAVQVLSANILFLASLIMASRHYSLHNPDRASEKHPYLTTNINMIGLLTASIYFGNVYGMNSLANTAVVYAVLYGFEKYNELFFYAVNSTWVYMFTVSLMAYQGALWVHTHPEFIIALFIHDRL